jgi:hypothetical protein
VYLTYTGPLVDGVDVVHADPDSPDANTVTHCPPGETVDLPDDVAEAQLATGLFEPATAARSGPPSRNASQPTWAAYAVAQGWTPESAENTSRAELIEALAPPDQGADDTAGDAGASEEND